MVKVKVDQEKCEGEGTCADICPVEVFEIKEIDGKKKSFVVDEEACLACMACVNECPASAIEVTEE